MRVLVKPSGVTRKMELWVVKNLNNNVISVKKPVVMRNEWTCARRTVLASGRLLIAEN